MEPFPSKGDVPSGVGGLYAIIRNHLLESRFLMDSLKGIALPELRDLIEQVVRGQDADYVEIRIDENETTRVQYRGRELEDIGQSTNLGGAVRAAVKGGWGFASFNDLSNLRDKVELAVQQARLIGKESSGPHHQDSGEAKIRESTAGVSRKPSSDCKACGCSSKHLCGLTAWNT